jgi:hypothetical protein
MVIATAPGVLPGFATCSSPNTTLVSATAMRESTISRSTIKG